MLGINPKLLLNCSTQQLLAELSAGTPYQHQPVTSNIKVSKLSQTQVFPQFGSHLWTPDVSTASFPTTYHHQLHQAGNPLPSSGHPHSSRGQIWVFASA